MLSEWVSEGGPTVTTVYRLDIPRRAPEDGRRADELESWEI